MRAAVTTSQSGGFAHVLDDPFFVVLIFDLGGQFNSGHGFAHVSAVIIFQRCLIHHHQRVHFAKMEVCIDKALGNKVSACIDHFFG